MRGRARRRCPAPTIHRPLVVAALAAPDRVYMIGCRARSRAAAVSLRMGLFRRDRKPTRSPDRTSRPTAGIRAGTAGPSQSPTPHRLTAAGGRTVSRRARPPVRVRRLRPSGAKRPCAIARFLARNRRGIGDPRSGRVVPPADDLQPRTKLRSNWARALVVPAGEPCAARGQHCARADDRSGDRPRRRRRRSAVRCARRAQRGGHPGIRTRRSAVCVLRPAGLAHHVGIAIGPRDCGRSRGPPVCGTLVEGERGSAVPGRRGERSRGAHPRCGPYRTTAGTRTRTVAALQRAHGGRADLWVPALVGQGHPAGHRRRPIPGESTH